MGQFSQKKHEEANDQLINLQDTDSKFESLVEVLGMLSKEDAKKTFAELVDARITAAIGDEGIIKAWADQNYEAKQS